MGDSDWVPTNIDTTTPHPARVYDYVLGGKDNYAADREYADRIMIAAPDYPNLARANRAFMTRTARFVAEKGVRQFIDLGTGIPTSPNLHEVVREVTPSARVVYVDNDPIVSVYSGALLAPDDQVASILADVCDVDAIMDHPELQRLIDFTEPVGVSFIAVLQLVPDEDVPRIVARFHERMVPGSYIAISQPSGEGDPEAVARARAATQGGPIPIEFRTYDQILAFFDGFELVEPGLVDVTKWHPRMEAPRTGMIVLGGVAERR